MVDMIIRLKDKEPIATGSARAIYLHPENPSVLIKVIRPNYVTRWKNKRIWRKRIFGRLQRFSYYRAFHKELVEYIAVYAYLGFHPNFLPRAMGLVATDLGLGLCSLIEMDENGQTAVSLHALVETGRFNEQHQRDLDEFFDAIQNSNLILNDFHAKNIVYSYSHEQKRKRFVLIDGFGESSLVPIKRLLFINRCATRKRIAILRKALGAITPPAPGGHESAGS